MESSKTGQGHIYLACDISPYIRNANQTTIRFNWTSDAQSYIAIVRLVKENKTEKVVENIKAKFKTKESILELRSYD